MNPITAFQQLNQSPFVVSNVPFQGIGAGLIANAIIPVGQTYLTSSILMTIATVAATRAQIIAQVEYLQILVNGVEVANLTGTEWVYLQEFYSHTVANGFLDLFYERPWMQEPVVQRGFAYGMVDQNSFQINVKLAAGATIDGIALYHRVDPLAERMGRHVEYRKQSHTFGSTGQDRIIDLPQAVRGVPIDAIAAIHLECDETKISNLIVRAEGIELWNAPYTVLKELYGIASDPRTPKTGFAAIDFLNRNWLRDQLPDNMKSLEIVPTWTAAPNTYPIIVELITGSPNEVKSG
jgi:hypothetical protein